MTNQTNIIQSAAITDEQIRRLFVQHGHIYAGWLELGRAIEARALAARPVTPAPTQAGEPIDKYVALAEKCGAEVGRYEGAMVWMKFHSQSAVVAFATGIVMLAALKPALAAPSTPTSAERDL